MIFYLALYEVFVVFAGYKHLISGNELEIVCMQEFVLWFSCNRKFFGFCHLCREILHDKCLRKNKCVLCIGKFFVVSVNANLLRNLFTEFVI